MPGCALATNDLIGLGLVLGLALALIIVLVWDERKR
jgi:hypothetical protein